jgi:hypothetical protein
VDDWFLFLMHAMGYMIFFVVFCQFGKSEENDILH